MSNEWIKWKWTPKKPYPETLETRVYCKFSDGEDDEHNPEPETVGFWMQGMSNQWKEDNKFEANSKITHYRVVK